MMEGSAPFFLLGPFLGGILLTQNRALPIDLRSLAPFTFLRVYNIPEEKPSMSVCCFLAHLHFPVTLRFGLSTCFGISM
jgi:hypothetical protein